MRPELCYNKAMFSGFLRPLLVLVIFFAGSSAWAQKPNVNERTLNLFLPVTHLSLPCFVSIEVKAAYNSYSGARSIFGRKWTFNHNIYITEDILHITVHEGDGFENKYRREKNLKAATEAVAQKIVLEIKKEDAKNKNLREESEYAKIEKKLIGDKSFRDQQEKKYIKSARPLGPGEYFSLKRGQTSLIKKADGTYERRFPNGSKEFFNKQGRIAKSQDRNGNELKFTYQGDQLIRINDICGRSVEFDYYTTPALAGLVRSIKDSLGRELQFTFDSNKRLIGHTTIEGHTITYRYSDLSYITEISNSSDKSKTIRFGYNKKLEVIEQTGPGNSRVTYNRTYVAEDPNHSITELKTYEGGSLQSREVYEEKVGQFRVVTKFNSKGTQQSKKTTQFSEVSGFPKSIVDDKGRGELFEYDQESGKILSKEAIGSKRKLVFSHHSRCDQIEKITITQPNTPTTEMSYAFDQKCNPIEAKEVSAQKPTGHITVKYDKIGRTTFMFDEIGKRQIAFTHWPYGRPESITLRDVGTLLIKYRPTGVIEKVDTFPHGEGKKKFAGLEPQVYQQTILKDVRGALDQMIRLLKPAGLSIGI